MYAPTVTMQSQKKSPADSSWGRFQCTNAPTAKINIYCANHTRDQT
jgi:hypothetical protein